MQGKIPSEISKVIPSAGFIRDYVEYAVKRTDAPAVYHVGCSAAIISTLMAERVRLVVGTSHEPLNLWVMLSGRSSMDRKSTAVRLAQDLITAVAPQRVAPISGSMEGLFSHLAEEPCSVLVAPELVALLDQMEASYWRQGRSMLMDLYDGAEQYVRQLSNREPIVIERPRISVLAASSATLLDQTTRQTDWSGGFMARFLVLYGERSDLMQHPREDPYARKQLINSLHEVLEFRRGYVEMTPEAMRVHGRFVAQLDRRAAKSPEYLHGLICRLGDHIARIGAIYALTNHTNLGKIHMKKAVEFGKIALHSIDLISDRIAQEPKLKLRAKILAKLSEHPEGMFTRDLLRCRILKRELDPMLESLLEEEMIGIESWGRRKRRLVFLAKFRSHKKPKKRRNKPKGKVIPIFPKKDGTDHHV